MVAGTPSRFSFFSLILLFVLFAFSSTAWAETKLGIALKQGYDYPYISEIDPKGIGAASGFMKGDHIKEIGSVSIWFIGQAKGFLKFNLKKDKPFAVMVERDGSLQQVIVDRNKPKLSFPHQKGTDPYSDCYFKPNAACIEHFILQPDHTARWGTAFSHYSTNISTLIALGKTDKARAALNKMKAYFYTKPDPYIVRTYTTNVLGAMDALGEKPDQQFRDFVYQNSDRKKLYDMLGLAVTYKEYGAPKLGRRFLDDALRMLDSDPKSLGVSDDRYGRALAAFEMHDRLRAIIVSKTYFSFQKNSILKGALIYHVKQEDAPSVGKIMDIIINTPRSWTDTDRWHYVRLFHKLHFEGRKKNMLSHISKQYDDLQGNMFQTAVSTSVIRALGASGQIHRALTYIDKSPGDSLALMMYLAIEAANSRSSHGIAVRFYKDFPKLLTDTYALLKTKTPEQRKKLGKTTLLNFYKVLAVYLPSPPSIRELDGLGLQQYHYESIIDHFIEVRKYGAAFAWADDIEKRFRGTYKYSDIYTALGGIASYEEMNRYKQHAGLAKHKNRFHRQLLDRLYWGGYLKEARAEFAQLDEKNKRSAIRNQLMFITPCESCDL